MRAIESKKEIEKRNRKNQWIIGGILIVIMLGSTFGIIVNSFGNNNSNTAKVEYNGYKFVNQNDYWTTTIGSYNFIFRYNPTQVEKINSNIAYVNNYSGVPVYISSEDYVSEVEIYQNLGNIVQRFQRACLEEKGCAENIPIKDCANNFIIIRKANESRISQNQSCVFIQGPQENLTAVTDEFLFKILGIEN
jgi:hypothetical protein